MQLLGFNTFKWLFALCGLPELIVYDFHTYELGRVSSYQSLSTISKLEYYRAQKLYNDPADVFEAFVKYILSKGYEPKYLENIYRDFKSRAPPWRWVGD